jgi:hypothetical protein
MDKPLRTANENKILTIDESSDAGPESKRGGEQELQEFRSCGLGEFRPRERGGPVARLRRRKRKRKRKQLTAAANCRLATGNWQLATGNSA